MREHSDSELMKLYAAGNPGAFQELFRRYEGRAYAYFLRRARSPERASDLYQELFFRIHRFRDRFDATQPFAPWFFRLAQRVWIDEVRRSFRTREVPGETEANPSVASSAEERAIATQESRRLLAELSPEQAEVLVAAKLGGIDYTEIAEKIGKSVDATKQVGSRALRKLRGLALESC